jgi:hypothetical protein
MNIDGLKLNRTAAYYYALGQNDARSELDRHWNVDPAKFATYCVASLSEKEVLRVDEVYTQYCKVIFKEGAG